MIVLLLKGCVNNYPTIPEGVLPEEKMLPILNDIMLAEEYSKKKLTPKKFQMRSYLIDSVYPAIFLSHNIDDSLFFESFNFYENHPHLYA